MSSIYRLLGATEGLGVIVEPDPSERLRSTRYRDQEAGMRDFNFKYSVLSLAVLALSLASR